MSQTNRGFATVALVIVIVVIAGVGGYFVVRKGGPDLGYSPSPTSTATPTKTPTSQTLISPKPSANPSVIKKAGNTPTPIPSANQSGSGICGKVIYSSGAYYSETPIAVDLTVYNKSGTVAARGRSGSDGQYRISVSPGIYTIVIDKYGSDREVSVEVNLCSTANLTIAAP